MRIFKEQETEMINPDKQGVTMSFADLAETCINHPPEAGFDLKETNKRLRLMNKIYEAKKAGETELEEAEYDLLVECFNEMRWGLLDRAISDFGAYVKEIQLME